ncbi:MAG: ShlB/FhaC/HecB family hemolysin secretion/activation protein [Thermomonas sp.]|uniref:ShlB/FhaC/HecB family hemolysin secretion/activation protein n=1 Tax=Thermomonas sp. TaxID=1971895 RepID=UPI0039E5CC13
MTSRSILLRRTLLFLAVVAAPGLHAQSLPDAGRVLRDTERNALELPPRQQLDIALPDEGQATPADSGVRLRVREFRFTGNSAVGNDELAALLADLRGQELSLAQLQAAALRITRLYRERGYPLARAWLPQQEIDDGVLRIDVLEGRYGEVRVENGTHTRATALRPLGNLKSGDVVESAPLEKNLLLVRDLPGVELRSTLQPGASVGTTDLVVEVLPGKRFDGSIELDNFGNYYTGEYRLGGSFNINNPLGLGDQLSLRVLGSDGDQRYGRLGWQGSMGALGTRVGVAYSAMRYELGRDFAVLDASGKADIASAWVMQPLLRSRDFTLSLSLQYDAKRLEDSIDLIGARSSKRTDVWALGLNGYGADDWMGGGLSSFALTLGAGRLDLEDPQARLIDAVTARTQGSYRKLNASAARLQRLGGAFSLLAQVEAQWTGDNLDSSEKFALGGVYGVRAYPQGEAAGDKGMLARVELRYALTPGWQLAAFADHGRVRLNHRPWSAGDNSRELSGAGLGVNWTHGGWQAALGAAWKLGSEDALSGPDREPRLWAQLVRRF